MINKTVLVIVILAAGSLFAVSAQDAPTVSTPAVPDNAQPLSDNIKLRSVELERIKRDAEEKAVLRQENGKVLSFSEIKDDFEGMQKQTDLIVGIYQSPGAIDYKSIGKEANEITAMAIRLRGNVFMPDEEEAKKDRSVVEENPYVGKGARDLIIELYNSVGDVVQEPMWQNLQVIDPEASRRTEGNLVKVIQASNALWIATTRMEKQ